MRAPGDRTRGVSRGSSHRQQPGVRARGRSRPGLSRPSRCACAPVATRTAASTHQPASRAGISSSFFSWGFFFTEPAPLPSCTSPDHHSHSFRCVGIGSSQLGSVPSLIPGAMGSVPAFDRPGFSLLSTRRAVLERQQNRCVVQTERSCSVRACQLWSWLYPSCF